MIRQFRSLLLRAFAYSVLAVPHLYFVSDVSAASLGDVVGLSQAAKDSLVAHFDATQGIQKFVTGGVSDWTPIDSDGNLIPGAKISSQQRGSGAATLIDQISISDPVIFDDTEIDANGRHLEGTLSGLEDTSSFTIFWRGLYSSESMVQNSEMSAYNLGTNTSHERHQTGSRFHIEINNGSANTGDDITRFDDQDTIWCTVVSGSSHSAYANGIDLNVTGAAIPFTSTEPSIILGAFGDTGCDFIGEIRDVIIFDSALSDTDRSLVRAHLSPRIVTNLSDVGPGSLRQTIADAAEASLITFHPDLSGQTIALAGNQLSFGKDLTIDATALPVGITIDAAGQSRIFHVQRKTNAALYGITLTGGVHSIPFGPSGYMFPDYLGGVGGAIFNEDATLSLRDCIITGNSASISGGAIFSFGGGPLISGFNGSAKLSISNCIITDNFAADGGGAIVSAGFEQSDATLTLDGCTISENSTGTGIGGGIVTFGAFGGSAILSLDACTLSDNSAFTLGGAIFCSGTEGSVSFSLSACTLSGNAAKEGGGIFFDGSSGGSAFLNLSSCTLAQNSANEGGGIYIDSSGGSATLNLSDTILAGNTAPIEEDLFNVGDNTTITPTGMNLIGNSSLLDGAIGVIMNPGAGLAPLGDYGGPMVTMPPLPGSPAIDAALTSVRTTDQRGFPLVGIADIGATEFQGSSDLDPIWEIDHDGDGITFGTEFALGTDPFVADLENPANPTLGFDSDTGEASINIGVNPAAIGFARWIVERTTDLQSWDTDAPFFHSENPPSTIVIDASSSAEARTFYRFTAEMLSERD